jgi:hypothetical protein
VAEIIRKTESTFFGPWLLDSAALAAIDEIIEEQWARLEAHRQRQINNAVRRERDRLAKADSNTELSEDHRKAVDKEIRQRVENDHRYPDDGRTITLTLSSGNKVRVNSFREAAGDVNCQDQEVAKVEVRLCCGGIRGDLAVPTPDKSHGLSLVTLPEASEQAVELFVRLHRWCEQYKPDLLRRLWGANPGTVPILAGSIVILCFVIALVTGSVSMKDPLRDEINTLIAKGVKAEDQGRALELRLRKSADLPADRQSFYPPIWFFAAAATMFAVTLLLSFGARTAFEIGKGAASVRWQKRYDGFLRKIIPSFLVLGVLASALGSFVYDLLRSK